MTNKHKDRNEALAAIATEAVQVWQKAQIVMEAAYWDTGPEALSYMERLRGLPNSETLLQSLVENENRFVAAYALLTLRAMNSQKVRELPPKLLDRKDRLTIVTGSFSRVTTLGDFARRLRKDALAQNDP